MKTHGLEVFRDGTVKRNGRPARSYISNAGYLRVGLHLVHRLVAEAFHGPCPLGYEVDHVNGDKLDNRAVNLEYVTRCEHS